MEAAVVCGFGREANLIVRNNVYGATTGEVRQLAKGKCFIGGALAREGGVAVSLNVHNNSLVLIRAKIVHLSPGFAHRDSVLRLKVARVVNHRHSDFTRIASVASTLESFRVADGDVSWDIINAVGKLFWDVILA